MEAVAGAGAGAGCYPTLHSAVFAFVAVATGGCGVQYPVIGLEEFIGALSPIPTLLVYSKTETEVYSSSYGCGIVLLRWRLCG